MAKDKKKDFNYFDFFCTTADIICEAANYLHSSLTSYNQADFISKVEGMHEIENRADISKHDMTKNLMHEFLPPIEREDIIELAAKLDDIVDALDDAMHRIYMYNASEIREGAIKFSDLIVKSAAALKETMEEFRRFKSSKTIKEKLVEVNTLESDGDYLHSDLLHDLFCNEKDTRELITWMNIYEDLEACLDYCEDAADIIESVIMKNT